MDRSTWDCRQKNLPIFFECPTSTENQNWRFTERTAIFQSFRTTESVFPGVLRSPPIITSGQSTIILRLNMSIVDSDCDTCRQLNVTVFPQSILPSLRGKQLSEHEKSILQAIYDGDTDSISNMSAHFTQADPTADIYVDWVGQESNISVILTNNDKNVILRNVTLVYVTCLSSSVSGLRLPNTTLGNSRILDCESSNGTMTVICTHQGFSVLNNTCSEPETPPEIDDGDDDDDGIESAGESGGGIKLSSGELAGIVIALLVIIIVVVSAGVLFVKRRPKQQPLYEIEPRQYSINMMNRMSLETQYKDLIQYEPQSRSDSAAMYQVSIFLSSLLHSTFSLIFLFYFHLLSLIACTKYCYVL